MRRTLLVLMVAAMGIAQPTATEGRRLALVIANSAYQKPFTPLSQPPNEAGLMKETLESAGFAVTRLDNLPRTGFLTAEASFVSRIQAADTVVVYYSGNAVQGKRDNYLLPVDFDPKNPAGLDAAYSLRRLQGKLEKARLKVFILEAARAFSFSIEGVEEQGLMAQPEPPTDSLFAFAAATGQTVVPANDRVGLFTRSVAKSMKCRGYACLMFSKRPNAMWRTQARGRFPPCRTTSFTPIFISLTRRWW